MGSLEGQARARQPKQLLRNRAAISALAVAAMVTAMAGPAAAADKKAPAPKPAAVQKADNHAAKDAKGAKKDADKASKDGGNADSGQPGQSAGAPQLNGNGNGNAGDSGAGDSAAAVQLRVDDVPASAAALDNRVSLDDPGSPQLAAAGKAAKADDKAGKADDKAAKDAKKDADKAAKDAEKCAKDAAKAADKAAKDAAKGKAGNDKKHADSKSCTGGTNGGSNGGGANDPGANVGSDTAGTTTGSPAAADEGSTLPLSDGPVTQVLAETVSAPAATLVRGSTLTATPAASHSLPMTGGESGLLALLAGGLVSLGAGIKLLGRRQRRA